MKHVKTFESFKLIKENNIGKIQVVHDVLESFIPSFKYDDYILDYEKRNDKSGDYNVWIEFTDVPADVIEDLDNNYSKYEEEFKNWNTENNHGLYLEQILSTSDSITYLCIV